MNFIFEFWIIRELVDIGDYRIIGKNKIIMDLQRSGSSNQEIELELWKRVKSSRLRSTVSHVIKYNERELD